MKVIVSVCPSRVTVTTASPAVDPAVNTFPFIDEPVGSSVARVNVASALLSMLFESITVIL